MMPTYDFETEADALKRKQAIVDAMQQSALRPIDLPQQPGAKVSVLNVLAKLLEGYVAGKASEGVKSERTALAQRYGDELRSGMEQYYKTMQGYETPSPTLAPNADGSPQMVKVPGDRKKAIFDALASNHPVLRDLAMQQLKEEGKNQLTPKDLLTISTPESVLANINNPGAWKPKRELKAVAPGEVLLDSSGNFATPGNPGGTPPWQVTKIAGDLYQQSATGLKKLDNAPRVTVNNSVVNQGESAFLKKLGELSADDLVKAKQAKIAGQRMLQSVQKLDQLDKAGVYSGPTANAAMFIGSFAEALGVPVNVKKLANSQAYQGEVMSQMQQYLTGSMARSTTDKDAEILKAPLPQLINSPEGRAALRRQLTARAQENIQYADRVQKNLERTFPEAARLNSIVPGTVDVPQRSDIGNGSSGVPIPLDQYLKNFGGK